MIVVDTSGVLAAKDEDQPQHAAVARTLTATTEDLLLSPFVFAECDYMLATRLGAAAAREFLGEVVAGAYQLVDSMRVTWQPLVASSIGTRISRSGWPTRHWSSSRHVFRPRGF